MISTKQFSSIIFFIASIVAFNGLQASITTQLFGPMERAQFGTELASQLYQDKAHEFLNCFGVNGADSVEIYKINWALHSEYRLLPGMASRSGIWLNETILD